MTEPTDDHAQPQTLNWFGGLIAFLLILELYGLTYGFMFIKIPTENTSNISQITGAVLLQVGIIIGWFFRTSQEAKKQAETISTMAITAAKAQAAANPAPTTTTTTTTVPAASPAPVVAGTATPAQTIPTPATVTVPLHAGQTASVVADAPTAKENDMSNQNPKAPGQIIKPDPRPGEDGYVAPKPVNLAQVYDASKPVQNDPGMPNYNPGPRPIENDPRSPHFNPGPNGPKTDAHGNPIPRAVNANDPTLSNPDIAPHKDAFRQTAPAPGFKPAHDPTKPVQNNPNMPNYNPAP